jgi:hypothetical protein
MDIKLRNEMPILSKWIVKYDDIFEMPQFVQGRLIGDFDEMKNGQSIIVNNVESIDLKDKILKTKSGFAYKLIGSGRRMIIIDEDDIVDMAEFEEF